MSKKMTAIKIEDSESQEIKTLEAALLSAKIALADAYSALEVASARVREATAAYVRRIEEAAEDYKIDLSDPTKEKWNYVVEKATFFRV